MIKKKKLFTCPFVFAAKAAPSAGFSTAASSFPAVLEICAPMLFFGATKEPNRSTDWTKTASFLPKIQVKRRHLLLQPKPRNKPETKNDRKGTCENSQNVAKTQKKREFFQFFFFSSSRVCKWRNWPRRKWDAEYNAQVHWWMGTGAMTTKPPRLHQSQVRNPTSRVVVVVVRGVSWSWGREGRVMDTIGETTTTWPTTCF